jgi:predicted GH43/DUF377 family glycosyl hydrolase
MTAKAAATLCFCISASLITAGCGRYADFSLPVLPNASAARPPRFHFAPEPLLSLSDKASRDVLNPSVAMLGGTYFNLYSAFDGSAWHTNLATSVDGLHWAKPNWAKQGRVLSPNPATWEGNYIAANGSVLAFHGELWYWYQAGNRANPLVGLARSSDGKNWRKEAEPVLGLGPYMSWDERAVADPFVFETNGWLYLYYLGQNRAALQQLGVARSQDGVHWQKLRSNPIVAIPSPGTGSPAENGLGEPAVWQRTGSYWMLYTGRDAKENRSLQLMRSADGVHWTAVGNTIRGGEAWNAKVLCDPTVLGNRFWFGGGDVASPDENLHGQIGTGVIE